MLTVEMAEQEYRRLSTLVDEGLAVLWTATHDFADAERAYRKQKAEAWADVAPGGRGGLTVPEREAQVNSATADLRFQRDLADGIRQAALEAVRARRSQMSGMQSLLAFIREEMGMAKFGADVSP